MNKIVKIISVMLLLLIVSQSAVFSYAADRQEGELKAQIIKTVPFAPDIYAKTMKFKFKVNKKGYVKVLVLDDCDEVIKTLVKDKRIQNADDKEFSLKWDFSQDGEENKKATAGTYKIKIVLENNDKTEKATAKSFFNIVDGSKSVWLDAGHGGMDAGAIRTDGKYERDDNLKIAKQVRKILKKQGIVVYMSRTDKDKNYASIADLKKRIKKANKAKVDLFVSFHRNVAAVSSANGFNIYTHNPKYKSNVRKKQAKNKASQSMKLSKNIFKEMSKVTEMKMGDIIKGSNNREDFFVNKLSNMPSCMLETGYVTNVSDNKQFDKNYKTYAEAISKGIMKTLGITYIEN